MQLSVACRNALLNSLETTIGASPRLEIHAGSIPANCATADGGSPLATMVLTPDWLDDAASGSKSKGSNVFEDTNAEATGTATFFRIKDSSLTTCHMQGNITVTSGGGDMEFDSVSITAGQFITITSFTLLAGNA